MAIELLDIRKQWAKIKGGFGNGRLYRNPNPPQHRTYVNGVDSMAMEAQGIGASPKGSVFGGKTFSQRK